jgi:hypothetical protein
VPRAIRELCAIVALAAACAPASAERGHGCVEGSGRRGRAVLRTSDARSGQFVRPGARPCESAPGASVQDRLDRIARCFHDAVVALQREPAQGESLAAFLGAARVAEPRDLSLADGAVVAFEVVRREHDSYEGGRTDLVTTYRFAARGHPETAETAVVASIP